AHRVARDRRVDGGGVPPLGAASTRHVADRRSSAPGGGARGACPRRATVTGRAGGDRGAVASPPGDGRAAALAPLPRRARAGVSTRQPPPALPPWCTLGYGGA